MRSLLKLKSITIGPVSGATNPLLCEGSGLFSSCWRKLPKTFSYRPYTILSGFSHSRLKGPPLLAGGTYTCLSSSSYSIHLSQTFRQPETQYLDIDAKASRRVAYINVTKQEAPLTIVYLPGFFGLKTGTKSDAIRFFCNQHGYNFLSFEYEGIGESTPEYRHVRFQDWVEDVSAVLKTLTSGTLILVGSSMGSWLSTLVYPEINSRVAAMVFVSPAFNFLQPFSQLFLQMITPEQKKLLEQGVPVVADTEYGQVKLNMQLAESSVQFHLPEGKNSIHISCPVRVLHGMLDKNAPYAKMISQIQCFTSQDVNIILRKEGEHHMSSPNDVNLLISTIKDLIQNASHPTSI